MSSIGAMWLAGALAQIAFLPLFSSVRNVALAAGLSAAGLALVTLALWLLGVP